MSPYQRQRQHRHQLSLEGILDFSQPFTLPPHESQAARAIFQELINNYDSEQRPPRGYKPIALVQATFDHVASKDTFLMLFLSFLYETLCSRRGDGAESDISPYLAYFSDLASWNSARLSEAYGGIEAFAEFIVENFLLPRMSLVGEDPTTNTSIVILNTNAYADWDKGAYIYTERTLREARKRFDQYGEDSKDDDGNLLREEINERFSFLEVAHILPHSLVTVASADTELSDSKKNALRILDMFDPGIIHLIEYPKIDSPMNALTLTLDNHRLFGEFQIYFEPTGMPHEYRIDSTERSPFLRDPIFPITRTLSLSPNRTIDPPSPRLLGVHRAISRIMNLSGAGEYIDRILEDLEKMNVKEDGSTNLGQIMKLRLGGWPHTLTVF
ncbi:uncharacterized protein BHQ10_010333 [Talaromyces amestolkiae]|uniref:HNH nuclease domain-containing protein n=1 Tax=Talaromyces amestolkiae TaxID=1196081 RepID=A0A364LF32_TALAM|nr:uncharacterized protein BHQ10_010333 [Talaromyces amestolkiae]RAO74321.1 hypothetical protein BHQ10_010333 [Talaromyces amestolkiae]